MRTWALLFMGYGVLGGSVAADPDDLGLARLFTDGAVLQRDRPVPIWGTSAPRTAITLSFSGQRLTTVSDAGGRWRVDLAAMPANAQGRELVVEASDGQSKVLSDVLVGDVWFCSGQSNMELGMASIANRTQEVKDLKYPSLRLYLIAKTASGKPREEVFGAWAPSDRQTVTSGGWNGFSAVAYTFGRRLNKELGVPIGVIQAAYGGSPILAWISPAALAADSAYAAAARWISQADASFEQALKVDPLSRHPFDDPSDTKDLGPGSAWNAVLEPLGPLSIKGVLWYQGETDVGDGPLYTKKMNTLISSWREKFHQPQLPFYFVQIAPWQGYGGDSLPRLWAAQEAVLATPGTGMALTIDVGDFDDIHPANKRPVGERLALQALAKTYGRAVAADGPVVLSIKRFAAGLLVLWKAGPLTTSDGKAPTGFEALVRGSWVPVGAVLRDGGVYLEAEASGVRYAWSPTPRVNLTDASGLPARPFLLTPNF